MFSKLTPCSPIWDGRMELFLQPCLGDISGISLAYLWHISGITWVNTISNGIFLFQHGHGQAVETAGGERGWTKRSFCKQNPNKKNTENQYTIDALA